MAKVARSYRLTDHGVDNAQFFPGHGTAFTNWEDSATGIGDTIQEAVDDALETLQSDDWDVSQIEPQIQQELEGARDVSAGEIALEAAMAEVPEDQIEGDTDEEKEESRRELAEESLEDSPSELYYYVSIDVSESQD